MNTEEIFKQSGYTIPTDKHDECSKRFDYWDMIAFADLVIEKQQKHDSNLSQHLVSKRELAYEDMIEFTKWIISKGYEHRLDILSNELIGFYLVNKESIIKNNDC